MEFYQQQSLGYVTSDDKMIMNDESEECKRKQLWHEGLNEGIWSYGKDRLNTNLNTYIYILTNLSPHSNVITPLSNHQLHMKPFHPC
jgi:hypothetical protein